MNEPDNLEKLLGPTSSEAPFTFRARLRDQTTRQLRRSLAITRVARVAALAASFIAGGATVWLALPSREPEVVIVERVVEKWKPPEPPPSPRSPHELELAAEQADGVESAKLFLDAGRRYGNYLNDWSAAMRCYRNAFDLNSEVVEKTDPSTDDWLLVKLKTDWRDRHANP
jgi:hypothetical protein